MGGSVAACVLVATAILVPALDAPWWSGLVFGAAIAVTATIGDLGESLIKRDLGIKDMGNLLDRKSTRLNSSHANISYAVFCLKQQRIPVPFSRPPTTDLHAASTGP